VALVESGGANLMYQAEIFVDGGRTFANQARLSAAGIPQIAVVHGASTAGGAYLPGLSDYVVLVRGRSSIYLAGPPLVKAAIGEDAGEEELGGAETACRGHRPGRVPGRGRRARDRAGARADGRAALGPRARARRGRRAAVRSRGAAGRGARRRARTLRRARGHRALVDGSDFLEFKAPLAADTVCGHARIQGHRIGLIGNNGPIQPAGSTKAAQFIQLCDQSGTPLVFLQNTTGYMVGKAAEQAGAIKHGSKMIQAVANARVPKFTIVLGGSFGAGNYGMCGRGFDPRFIFAWPSARTAVMGGAQAAMVMDIVNRNKLQKMGQCPPRRSAGGDERRAAPPAGRRERRRCSAPRGCGTTASSTRATRAASWACAWTWPPKPQARTLRPNTFGIARL
jgi:geranyl-CoA carboxylase beta subunit